MKTTFEMKSMKGYLMAAAVALISATAAHAQQDPMYNQYLFNAYTINPAEAGARNYGTVSMLYRWQWVGIEGAPNTGSFGLETGIGKGWGIGLNVVDDRIGPTSNQTVNMAVSYHLNLTERTKMAVGLNGVINTQRVSLNKLKTLIDLNDPALTNNVSQFNPNAGGGVLIYNERSFFGVAMPRLIEYKLTNSNLVSIDQLRHLFIYAGKTFPLGTHLKFKPSVLTKVVDGAPMEFDVNGVINFYNLLDLGVNWRTGDGIGALAGITIKDRLQLNYAYEMPLTKIRYGSIQTHEIGLRYRFGKQNFQRIQSPRFFN